MISLCQDLKIWNIIFKTLFEKRIQVLSITKESVVLNEELSASNEVVLKLHKIKSCTYILPDDFFKTALKYVVRILIFNNDVKTLKLLACFTINGKYKAIIHRITLMLDIQFAYDNIEITDTEIIFMRNLLWSHDKEEESNIIMIHGLQYIYKPSLTFTSLSISFNCMLLWDLLLDIKYHKTKDLLVKRTFKSVCQFTDPIIWQ